MHVRTLRPSTRTLIFMITIIKLQIILSKTMVDYNNPKMESLAFHELSQVL